MDYTEKQAWQKEAQEKLAGLAALLEWVSDLRVRPIVDGMWESKVRPLDHRWTGVKRWAARVKRDKSEKSGLARLWIDRGEENWYYASALKRGEILEMAVDGYDKKGRKAENRHYAQVLSVSDKELIFWLVSEDDVRKGTVVPLPAEPLPAEPLPAEPLPEELAPAEPLVTETRMKSTRSGAVTQSEASSKASRKNGSTNVRPRSYGRSTLDSYGQETTTMTMTETETTPTNGTIDATTTALAWSYEGYWATVLGDRRSAEDVVREFGLVGDSGPDDTLDEWLGTAEAESWRDGAGKFGELPEEWAAFHARALAELQAAAVVAAGGWTVATCVEAVL